MPSTRRTSFSLQTSPNQAEILLDPVYDLLEDLNKGPMHMVDRKSSAKSSHLDKHTHIHTVD